MASQVPATPAVELKDVKEKYELFDAEEKGKGAFSRVVVGKRRSDGLLVAVKIMQREILTGKKAEMVAHEKEILRRTRHPAIVNLIECITTPTQVFMIMELMQGDLFEFIVKRKKLTEVEAAVITKQLISAVAYLHENSIIHRDIKPENILINSENLKIHLADFGLAKVVQEWDVKSTPCGTSFYIAPEIIRGIEQNGAKPLCTTRDEVKYVDIWSCGIVVFVMIAGRPPFYGQVKTSAERRALLAKIDRGVLFPDAQWASVSEEAKDFIFRLLVQDPTARLTAAKAVHHPWLKLADAAPTPTTEVAGSPEMDSRAMVAEANDAVGDAREVGDTEGDATSYNVPRAAAPAKPPTKLMMGAVPVAHKKVTSV